MRRVGTAACLILAGAAMAAGCGSSDIRALAAVSVEPPAGADLVGETGPEDPPAGLPLSRLEPAVGSIVSYEVTVRSIVGVPVTVVGARGQPEDEGVLVGERVEGTPIVVAPRGTATLKISGRVAGCAYDGQLVAVYAPRLKLRTGGEEGEQQVVLPARIELVAPRREACASR